MDIDEDRSGGRRTTAVMIGVRNSKLLLVALLVVEAAIAFTFFRGTMVSWFMLAAACFFLVDALVGPKRYPLFFVTAFFVAWNLIAIATMHIIWRYGLFVLA